MSSTCDNRMTPSGIIVHSFTSSTHHWQCLAHEMILNAVWTIPTTKVWS